MPGTVNYADWTFNWSIPTNWGGGLVISQARFRNTLVLYQATQPFVLVPYHGDDPHFKDGLNNLGAPFTPVRPTSANAHVSSGATPPASNDNAWHPVTNPTGAVVLETEAATLLEPAKAVVWCKLQCYNYQYIHRWEFSADGSIEAGVGLGGQLWTYQADRAGHVHNFYFRLDFDMVSAGNNLVQQFAHQGNAPGQDVWQGILTEGRRTRNLGQATKWRVLNKTPKPNGQVRSYELTSTSDMAPDNTYSTADLWVLQYDGSQDGAAVGFTDAVLGSTYLHGQNASVDGTDVVVWHCLRHHHQPRQLGEETTVVPYEHLGFHIQPRDFLDATPKNLYPTSPPSPI
jgi:hypothetical protein